MEPMHCELGFDSKCCIRAYIRDALSRFETMFDFSRPQPWAPEGPFRITLSFAVALCVQAYLTRRTIIGIQSTSLRSSFSSILATSIPTWSISSPTE